MLFNRPVIKMEVKQSMRQTRPHPMLVSLLYLVIVGAGAGLISWLMNALFPSGEMSLENLFAGLLTYGEDYLEYYMYYYSPQFLFQMIAQAGTVSFAVSLLTAVWSGLMNVGYAGYCLDMSRDMNPPLERIFSGFSRASSVILAYILVAIFTFLWSMLFSVGLGVLMGIAFVIGVNDSLAILGVLLIIAALILYAAALIWVSYRYVMAPFALADSQNPTTAMDAIRASKAMMRGRKGSFFVLRLSFIGWYLLEYLVVVVGIIIAFFALAGSINANIPGGIYSYGYSANMVNFSGFLVIILIILVCVATIAIINLWLTPYRTGCEARFYLYAAGSAQPGPYQLGPYGGWSGPYGGQPGPYNSQSGPYGGQYGPYGSQPGQYGSQPSPYSGQPSQYGSQPGPYGGQYGSQSGQYGQYNNPYGYQPPSQSAFGGYTQGPQPPRYGAGTYTQWSAPQAPQAPVTEAAEPPSAPAAPEIPVIPESPELPEAIIASVFDQAPAAPDDIPPESDDAPYEAPYAEPEAPNDGEQPSDPQI